MPVLSPRTSRRSGHRMRTAKPSTSQIRFSTFLIPAILRILPEPRSARTDTAAPAHLRSGDLQRTPWLPVAERAKELKVVFSLRDAAEAPRLDVGGDRTRQTPHRHDA